MFADGTPAHTDLITLNPNFSGMAPHRPARYQPADWSVLPYLQVGGGEAEVETGGY